MKLFTIVIFMFYNLTLSCIPKRDKDNKQLHYTLKSLGTTQYLQDNNKKTEYAKTPELEVYDNGIFIYLDGKLILCIPYIYISELSTKHNIFMTILHGRYFIYIKELRKEAFIANRLIKEYITGEYFIAGEHYLAFENSEDLNHWFEVLSNKIHKCHTLLFRAATQILNNHKVDMGRNLIKEYLHLKYNEINENLLKIRILCYNDTIGKDNDFKDALDNLLNIKIKFIFKEVSFDMVVPFDIYVCDLRKKVAKKVNTYTSHIIIRDYLTNERMEDYLTLSKFQRGSPGYFYSQANFHLGIDKNFMEYTGELPLNIDYLNEFHFGVSFSCRKYKHEDEFKTKNWYLKSNGEKTISEIVSQVNSDAKKYYCSSQFGNCDFLSRGFSIYIQNQLVVSSKQTDDLSVYEFIGHNCWLSLDVKIVESDQQE